MDIDFPSRALRRAYQAIGPLRVSTIATPCGGTDAAMRIISRTRRDPNLATTPGTKYIERPLLSYNTAKSALNSVTVQFANELRATPIKVNAVDPGFTNTDMTKREGSRRAVEAAAVVVRLATVGPDGPTGGFFDEVGPIPW